MPFHVPFWDPNAAWVDGDLAQYDAANNRLTRLASDAYEPTQLIAEQTLASAAATISLTSIPATFRHLRLVAYGKLATPAAFESLSMQFNGDTAANYDWQQLYATGASTVGAGQSFGATKADVGAWSVNAFGNMLEVVIPHYAGTTINNKVYRSQLMLKHTATSGGIYVYHLGGAWRSTAAINRIDLLLSAGNFAIGTVVSLYGMQGA